MSCAPHAGDEAMEACEPDPEPQPKLSGAPFPLLGAIRYGDSLVIQSTKYNEVFAVCSVEAIDDRGGGSVLGAMSWGADGWHGSRLRLCRATQQPAASRWVCFGDEVELAPEDSWSKAMLCHCRQSGLLCAQLPPFSEVAGGWCPARFRIECAGATAATTGTAAGSRPQLCCSYSDMKLVEVCSGKVLRAMSVAPELVGGSSCGRSHDPTRLHAEAVLTTVHSRFSCIVSSPKAAGGWPLSTTQAQGGGSSWTSAQLHVLCLVSGTHARSAPLALLIRPIFCAYGPVFSSFHSCIHFIAVGITSAKQRVVP